MNSRTTLTPASFVDLLRTTGTAFGADRVGRHAAALAYFTVFSLSPLLVVIISIAALYFGDEAKSIGAIQGQIQQTVGPTAGKAIEQMIQGANAHGSSSAKPILATIVALGVALWGASGLFGALQDSLNTIWGVMPKPNLGIMGMLRARFLSFAMVLGVGFLLLVSLILTTVIAAVSKMMTGFMGESAVLVWVVNFVLSLTISTLLFAAIFKVLPDVEINWHDVWVGAFVTALLFSLGRLFLGWFLARPGTASAYGSAGALVVLLLWVNYASTILFAGAEFTKAFANKFGSKIEPSSHAMFIDPDEATASAKPGMPPKDAPKNKASGAILTSTEVIRPNQPQVSKKQKQDFEYTLAVVAGAVIALAWAFRRRRREELKMERITSD